MDGTTFLDRVVERIYALWAVWLWVFYLGSGLFFLAHGVVIGDAVSRLTMARSVLNGYAPHRHPFLGDTFHLAALGFVWGPLPAALEIPIAALFPLFPGLVAKGYGGAIMSAPFMAWAAWSLYHLVLERSGSRGWARLLTAGFALNPFVIIFAGNGMSEAPYLAFLFAALRSLSRWQQHRRTSDLAAAGIWLAADCLVRYEVLAGVAGGVLFVLLADVVARGTATRRAALRRASVNALVLGLPATMTFALFLAISWWVTGTALGQFTSVYGQSAQIVAYGQPVYSATRVPVVLHELVGISPIVPLAFIAGLLPHRFRAGSIVPVVLAVLGLPLLFDIESLSTGALFNLIRYLILAIPVSLLSLLVLRRFGRIGLIAALAGVVVVWVSCWITIGNQGMSRQEYAYRQAFLGNSQASLASDLRLGGANQVTAWFDAQDMPDGSVLMDSNVGFMIFASTHHPRRFVLPPYNGFAQEIQYPWQHGVRYLVTIPPTGPGALDALNRYYPGLYDGCIQQAQLVLDVDGTGVPSEWRVYRLLQPVTPATIRYISSCPVHRIVVS